MSMNNKGQAIPYHCSGKQITTIHTRQALGYPGKEALQEMMSPELLTQDGTGKSELEL